MDNKRIAEQNNLIDKVVAMRDRFIRKPLKTARQRDDFWKKFTVAVSGLVEHSGDDSHTRDAIAKTFEVFNGVRYQARLPKLAFTVAETASKHSRLKRAPHRVEGYRELERQGAYLCALFLKAADLPAPQLAGVVEALKKSKSTALKAISFQPDDHESPVSAQPWCSLMEIQGLPPTIADSGAKPARASVSANNVKALDFTAGY